MVSTICGVTPDRQEVWRYDGPNLWTRLSGFLTVGELYGGRFGLFGNFTSGELAGWLSWWRRKGSPSGLPSGHSWFPLGSPGATFAVTAESVYGLTPDRGAVWRYDGIGDGIPDTGFSWTQVGGPAEWLWGGTYGLVARNPIDGNIFRYLGSPGSWEFIGGPGADFAVTADTVYGLTPGRDAVWRYDGTGNSWTRVGGPASKLYGGDFGLVATNPGDGDLFHHLGGPDNWQAIGGPGADFAVTRDTVFGLTPDKSAVYRYDGGGTAWSVVGGPADAIYAFEEQEQD